MPGLNSTVKGEKTLAEVSRELDIQPTAVRQWKRRFEASKRDYVNVHELRDAESVPVQPAIWIDAHNGQTPAHSRHLG
jgi:transposase-like protein